MVGDAEDRQRWARVHALTDAARRAESRATPPRARGRAPAPRPLPHGLTAASPENLGFSTRKGHVMSFAFNRDYDDKDQVAEWLPAFSEIREAMKARGEYPYNDSFKGLIPGIAGECEDTAIYLLQTSYAMAEEQLELARLRAEGFRELETIDETTRYPRVVVWREGYYSGGTGRLDTLEDARVVPRDGRPFAILPKGKRTNGYGVVGATVLVR